MREMANIAKTPLSEDAVVVNNLVKNFGRFRALDKLDLSVKCGEVHGFLGPNGAGKSTTIRVLLGLLRKTSGEVNVLDGDPWRDAVKLHRRLAYVPGEVNLWPNLSGGESIDLLGSLRGGLDKKRRTRLLEDFQLDPSKKFHAYSKGNRQKVALVAALAADVELFIFDEPTSGLDPLMEAVFQSCVKELRAAGKTVLLSSHILAEVEALCDRVTIISEGKAIESGTLSELQQLRHTSITVETEKPLTDLAKLKGLHNVSVDGNKAEFEVGNSELDTTLDYLTSLNIRRLNSHPPTLEELFLRYYHKDQAAAGKADR